MFFHDPDSQYDWLQRRYVESLRNNLGDEEARAVLTDEQVQAEVDAALDEIAAIAHKEESAMTPEFIVTGYQPGDARQILIDAAEADRRDPPPMPDEDPDDDDDGDDEERGGEG